ncbi:MAG TPA: energy-coupling factor transporter transmembrane component T [Pirellulales bacterium]|jgi:cobalt/nickel transport system permease protein
MLPDRLEHDSLDQGRGGISLLHRLAARDKLLAAFGLLVVVSLVQPNWWPVSAYFPVSWIHLAVAGMVACVVIVAKVPARYLCTRLLTFAIPLAAVGLSIPLSQGAAGWHIMAGVLVKGLLSFTTMLCLIYTTPFERLLQALRQCGVPKLIVAIVASMYRFIFVLLDELERMRRAQYARTFDCPRRLSPVTFRNGARAVGMLLVRCSERAERVHAAMMARGFDGEVRMLEERP